MIIHYCFLKCRLQSAIPRSLTINNEHSAHKHVIVYDEDPILKIID